MSNITQRINALANNSDAVELNKLFGSDQTGDAANVTLTNELRTDHATYKTAVDEGKTLIDELHDDHATSVTAVDELNTLTDELHDDHATNKTLLDEIKAAINLLAGSNVINATALAIGSTPEEYSHTAFQYRINGLTEAIALDATLAFTDADTINTGAAGGSLWGAWRIQIATGGTVTSTSAGADQVHANEAAAIAALPAAAANTADVGYITVEANAGASWTMKTDDLTPASDCVSVNYYNTTAPADIVNSSAGTLSATKATAGPVTLTASKPTAGPATITAAALTESYS